MKSEARGNLISYFRRVVKHTLVKCRVA